jgi:hypothetical protein
MALGGLDGAAAVDVVGADGGDASACGEGLGWVEQPATIRTTVMSADSHAPVRPLRTRRADPIAAIEVPVCSESAPSRRRRDHDLGSPPT